MSFFNKKKNSVIEMKGLIKFKFHQSISEFLKQPEERILLTIQVI